MILFLELSAIISFFILAYIYIGYPLLLFFLQFFVSDKIVDKKEIYPTISFVISCYNEEKVIREKIENSLSLDYPKEKLTVMVVSDASTDSTDEIVKEYKDRGVRLMRQEGRLGKTAGLNEAVAQCESEIVVFSDANAIYEPDAVKKLVRNFADKQVGYVVGEARYKDTDSNNASKSENTYWQYEIYLKKLESRLHSIVGADGAIYAIRKELYERLSVNDINDFANPIQIILKGYRGVYEPEAICWEEPASTFAGEFKRKVRIVNRAFSALLRLKSVLNPFKTGFYSLEIISHKLLRWLAPLFIIGLGISSFGLSFYRVVFFQWSSLLIILFCWLAYVGYLLKRTERNLFLFYYPYYFLSINLASAIGVFKSLKGDIQTTWETFRTTDKKELISNKKTKLFVHSLAFLSLLICLMILQDLFHSNLSIDKLVFWVSLITILYTYFGYPVILFFLSNFFNKPINKKEISPEVTLLICAYNEESVIEEKIKNCFDLDYPAEKIKFVIASDGSNDKTNTIVEEYTGEQLIFYPYSKRRGKTGTLNKTLPKLTGEIVVLSDANTMYKRDAIKKLVRNFDDPTVGGVSADVILQNDATTYGESESAYYIYERWIQEKETDLGSIIGSDGGMYAIRKELFEPPSPNIILDDFVISMNVVKKGFRLVYEKEARASEKNVSSFKEEFRRKSRVIAGAVQIIKQREGIPGINQKMVFFCFLSHKLLRWMVPVFLLLFLGVNIRLVIARSGLFYRLSLFTQTLFYLLALAGLFNKKIGVFKIPFYFCLVNGAALFGIFKGLFNKQSVKWTKVERG